MPSVTKAEFERDLNQGLYSYEIREFTRNERVAVGAWNGSQYNIVRWSQTGKEDQRFVLLPEPGGKKCRLQTALTDTGDRIFVGIAPDGGAILWPRSSDGSQSFELVWLSDTRFALREGTKGEFLDISDGGRAVRWSGEGGRNDRPKSNQQFELHSPQKHSSFPPSCWMKFVADSKRLSEISIPGTHDSGARYGLGARCQDWTIAQQLEAGVRYLDVRCRRVGKTASDCSLAIHHGAIFQDIMFGNVLNDCLSFLLQNPRECIVMGIQEEHTPESPSLPTAAEIFRDKYWGPNMASWYTSGSIPKLGDVRGKIVLVSRVGGFADQTPLTFGGSEFVIENNYEVFADGVSDKWNKVKANLDAAKAATDNPAKWYLTFASGSTGLLPETVAANINPKLDSYFEKAAKVRYGTILMDFVPETTIRRILDTN